MRIWFPIQKSQVEIAVSLVALLEPWITQLHILVYSLMTASCPPHRQELMLPQMLRQAAMNLGLQ